MSDQNQAQRASSLEVKDTEVAKVVFCTLCGWQRGLVMGAADKAPDECPQCKGESDKAAKIEDNEGNPIADIAEDFLNGLQSGEFLELETLVSVASPGSQHALRQRLKLVEMMWREGRTEAGSEGMDMRGIKQTPPEGGSASSVGSSVPGSIPSSSTEECTGFTASWCPVHGTCSCPREEDGSILGERDDSSCPLHSESSSYPEIPESFNGKCTACGQRVSIYSADEGTNSYVGEDAADLAVVTGLIPEPSELSGWDDPNCSREVAKVLLVVARLKGVEPPEALQRIVEEVSGGSGSN